MERSVENGGDRGGGGQSRKTRLSFGIPVFTRKSIWIIILALFFYVSLDVMVTNHQGWKGKLSPLETKEILSEYKYFIVALLKNNQSIMENWTGELLKLLKDSLGMEEEDSVYVSILENGDSQDETPQLLTRFKEHLNSLKIPNTIITEKRVLRLDKDRIEYLAELRNLAMEPLLHDKRLANWNPEKIRIIFLNDIWYKATDITELITTNGGKYDMACGLDFYFTFYDTWVTRDISGRGLWPSYPYFHERKTIERQKAGEPIRVFSCWNGVAILKAQPFLEKLVRFRPSNGLQPFHSECFWICYDFWSLNYNNILINPRVIVTYTRWHFYLQKYIYPAFINPLTNLLAWMTFKIQNDVTIGGGDSIPPPSLDRSIPSLAANWKTYR